MAPPSMSSSNHPMASTASTGQRRAALAGGAMSDENAGSASASFAQALSHAVAERGLSLEEVRRALDLSLIHI